MLFNKLKKTNGSKKRITILAPIEGELIPVAEVNDPTFSEELLGRGVAIRPAGGRAVSPVNGSVTKMFRTGHAVTLTSDEGVEMLIHVGLNTVELNGEHFTKRVDTGDSVKTGDVLVEFDLAGITGAGYETVVPVVVCNSDDFSGFEVRNEKAVSEGEEIIFLTGK